MTVVISKGSPVIIPAYRDVVFIEANYMHGDANGYSTEKVFYRDDQHEDIAFDLEGLAFLRTIMNKAYAIAKEDAAEKTRAFYAENDNFGLTDEDVENFIEQFVIQDDHDDSYEYCPTLQTVDVFHHDGHGNRFVMDVYVNGEPLHD